MTFHCWPSSSPADTVIFLPGFLSNTDFFRIAVFINRLDIMMQPSETNALLHNLGAYSTLTLSSTYGQSHRYGPLNISVNIYRVEIHFKGDVGTI